MPLYGLIFPQFALTLSFAVYLIDTPSFVGRHSCGRAASPIVSGKPVSYESNGVRCLIGPFGL